MPKAYSFSESLDPLWLSWQCGGGAEAACSNCGRGSGTVIIWSRPGLELVGAACQGILGASPAQRANQRSGEGERLGGPRLRPKPSPSNLRGGLSLLRALLRGQSKVGVVITINTVYTGSLRADRSPSSAIWVGRDQRRARRLTLALVEEDAMQCYRQLIFTCSIEFYSRSMGTITLYLHHIIRLVPQGVALLQLHRHRRRTPRPQRLTPLQNDEGNHGKHRSDGSNE